MTLGESRCFRRRRIESFSLRLVDQQIFGVLVFAAGSLESSSKVGNQSGVRGITSEIDRFFRIRQKIENLPAIDWGIPDHLPTIIPPGTLDLSVSGEDILSASVEVKIETVHRVRYRHARGGQDRGGNVIEVGEVVANGPRGETRADHDQR